MIIPTIKDNVWLVCCCPSIVIDSNYLFKYHFTSQWVTWWVNLQNRHPWLLYDTANAWWLDRSKGPRDHKNGMGHWTLQHSWSDRCLMCKILPSGSLHCDPSVCDSNWHNTWKCTPESGCEPTFHQTLSQFLLRFSQHRIYTICMWVI